MQYNSKNPKKTKHILLYVYSIESTPVFQTTVESTPFKKKKHQHPSTCTLNINWLLTSYHPSLDHQNYFQTLKGYMTWIT